MLTTNSPCSEFICLSVNKNKSDAFFRRISEICGDVLKYLKLTHLVLSWEYFRRTGQYLGCFLLALFIARSSAKVALIMLFKLFIVIYMEEFQFSDAILVWRKDVKGNIYMYIHIWFTNSRLKVLMRSLKPSCEWTYKSGLGSSHIKAIDFFADPPLQPPAFLRIRGLLSHVGLLNI